MLQVLRRLSKVLAYGSFLYLSVDLYGGIGATRTPDGSLVTMDVWVIVTIVSLVLAWIATKVADWVFADRES